MYNNLGSGLGTELRGLESSMLGLVDDIELVTTDTSFLAICRDTY